MHRDIGALSFADALVGEKGRNASLERIDELVDWGQVAAVVGDLHTAAQGRPSYPPLLMVKVLLLGQWHQLSDEGLEQALQDRLSFLRFCGFGMDEQTPDRNTIWRFRGLLADRGLEQALLAEIGQQLERHRLVLKHGTLLDATLVEAQAAKPKRGADGAAGVSPVDPDARWTRKYGRFHFGYQAHLGVDEDSSLIRKAELRPANVNESAVADDLISGDERAVYADKAYENKHRRERLKARGIKDRILHRRHKNQSELPSLQRRRNELIKPIRRKVEHVFGTLKRSYRYTRVRFYSLRANAVDLCLLAIAYNLRRAVVLLA
jgi:IS5 family transposase